MIILKDTIVMTCGGCPSQWDAETSNGKSVFIRVRHGYFTIDVDGEFVFGGNPYGVDGVMSTDDMIDYVNINSDNISIV